MNNDDKPVDALAESIQSATSQHIECHVGPMTWTSYAMDSTLAPDMSRFTQAEIADHSSIAASARTWTGSFALRSLFIARPVGPVAQYGFLFVRRGAATIREYELARAATGAFLAQQSHQRPAIALYTIAADHWETFLAQASQAAVLMACIAEKRGELFDPGDDSLHERLHKLYADSKHADGRLQSVATQAEAVFTVWMTNAGLTSKRSQLTWLEASNIVTDIANLIAAIHGDTGERSADSGSEPK